MNASISSGTSAGTAPRWRAMASCPTTAPSSTGVRAWAGPKMAKMWPGVWGRKVWVYEGTDRSGHKCGMILAATIPSATLFSFSECISPAPRFSRECLLPGFVGSGRGSLCGLGLQHGQAAGVWLWGQASPRRWQDPAEAHTAAAADPPEGRGRNRHGAVITLRVKCSPWRPARWPALHPPAQASTRWAELHAGDLGVGGVQSRCPFWGPFLQRLARLPGVSKGYPCSHENT